MSNQYLLFVALAILLSFASGAPQTRRHRRHWFGPLSPQDDQFHKDKILWNNSCGIVPKNDTVGDLVHDHRNRTAKPFKGLRDQLPNFVVRLNSKHKEAINTDDISQWFSEPFNSTYQFLAQIDPSISNIHLRKRHIEAQVYVGAFQYLRSKQLKHDTIRNENIDKTKALEYLLILAKNLLCEIETAINNTGMKMPMILTREQMDNRLTFRNNNRDRRQSDDVDEIDSKFAKVRFAEYLDGLQQVLRNRLGKKHRHMARRPQKQARKKNPVGEVQIPVKPASGHDNNVVSVSMKKKHPLHHKNVQKHRNRLGQKGRKHKPIRANVAALSANDIKNFRRMQRKSTTTTPSTPAPQPIQS